MKTATKFLVVLLGLAMLIDFGASERNGFQKIVKRSAQMNGPPGPPGGFGQGGPGAGGRAGGGMSGGAGMSMGTGAGGEAGAGK